MGRAARVRRARRATEALPGRGPAPRALPRFGAVLFAAVAAAVVLSLPSSRLAPALPVRPPSAAARAAPSAPCGFVAPSAPVHASSRRALEVPPPAVPEVGAASAPDPHPAPVARVRVQGRLRLAGRGAAHLELSFRDPRVRPGAEEAGWDVTDGEGRFDVELPPGTYDASARGGRGLASFVVPATRAELWIDLDL